MVQDEILKLKFDNSYGGKLFATQTDTGRTFTVQILSDRNEIINVTGMSLRLYVGNQKEVTYCDGEIIDAEKGKFKLQLFNSQLKYPGIQKAQFILKKDDRKIGSKIFDMHIEEGVEAGSSMGVNLVIQYEQIAEATEFLRDYDKTLEEAKNVDLSLKVGIKEGTDTREHLAACKARALEIKSDLETTTTNAQNILNEAVSFKDDVESIKNTLVEENTKANTNLTNLEAKIAEGKQTATDLGNKVAESKTTKRELEEANTAAGQIKTSLEETTSAANNAKTQLESLKSQSETLSDSLSNKIATGSSLQLNLATSLNNAVGIKNDLDNSISTATSTNTTLKETDTNAKNTEQSIRDLINQLNLTKDEVNQIIASGNLNQYVTDPKLQEALKAYAEKTEIPKNLSELLEDNEHKTITAAEKSKLANIEDGAEKNKVNSVNNKVGDVVLKLSDLENDKTFKTEAEIQGLINNSKKLKKEVVNSLPSSGQDDVIYLLKNKSDTNNVYTEYLWIGAKWEIIGNTKVDLTGYAKKTDIKTKLSEMEEDAGHKTLNDSEKAKVQAIPDDPKYTDTVPDLTPYAKKTDIKTKLSEMTSDSNNRTVSDTEKTKLANLKEQVILTETEYNALSPTQQNDENKIYFLKA